MNWKRTRISIWTAEGSDFKIAESDEAPGRPYRLESAAHLDEEPIFFASLKSAQAHAGTLAELAQLRAENARLRGETEPALLASAATSATGTAPLTPAQRAAATRARFRAELPDRIAALPTINVLPDFEDGDDPGPDDWDAPGGGPAPF